MWTTLSWVGGPARGLLHGLSGVRRRRDGPTGDGPGSASESTLSEMPACCAPPLAPADWLGGFDNVWALFGLGADAVDVAKDFQVAST